MSESTENQNVESRQEKLAPLRSLRDAGEEADIWKTITKRYPNAAPLLREMEVVIDRAENILRQVRSNSYNADGNSQGRSSSSEISISNDSEEMLSAKSVEAESLSTSEENCDVREVDTQISYKSLDSLSQDELNSSTNINQCEQVQNSQTEENCVKSENHNTVDSQIHETQDSVVSVGKMQVFGMEQLHNVDVKASKSNKIIGKKQESTIFPKETLPKITRKHQITKLDALDTKDTRNVFKESIPTTTRVVELTHEVPSASTKLAHTEASLIPKRRTKTTSDSSSPVRKEKTNSLPIHKDTEKQNNKNKGGSGDDSSPKTLSRTTPLDILIEYAEQCNQEVNFVNITKQKANSYKVECSFADYIKVEAVGDSEIAARNSAATKILKMFAENEMDEKYPIDLRPLSTEQLRYIIALETNNQLENAMRKLYKFCLENNFPKPVYTVRKDGSHVEGMKHYAECTAVNKLGVGTGIREDRAKILAAEDLYGKIISEHS